MKILKAILMASAIFALASLGALFLELRATVTTSEAKLNAALDHVDVVIGHLDEAAKQSVNVSRDTRINLVHLDRNQQQLKRELSAFIAHTDRNINGAGGVLYQTAITMQKVGEDADQLSASATPLLDHADMVLLHADDIVKSPAVAGSLKNIEEATGESRRGVKSAADSMEEVRQAIHEMRNPPKRTKSQRILDWIVRNIIGSAIQGSVRR
ncbi:MAG: hypothetical protein M3P27_02835 [Acidobacteriota bacterium]|nr:hypothetical protein [Acidobacteriota bacterium]